VTVEIERFRRPPHGNTFTRRAVTLYEVELSAAPSPAWQDALLHPPAALMTAQHTPTLGRLEINGPRVTFRTIPVRLHGWLRQIDRWIAYANSVDLGR
jgi:hypothetical protein